MSAHISHLTKLISKFYLIILAATLALTTIFSIPSTAKAWASDWYVWQYPTEVTYEIDYASCASQTETSWSTCVSDWDNAQNYVDLSYYYIEDILLTATTNNGVAWHGITTKTRTSPPNYYITYAVSWLNEYYTENPSIYDTANKRRSTAGHELGHTYGLSEYPGAVLMNTSPSERFSYGIYVPQQDDINGITVLYY